nr:ATP synthase subunit I [Oleiagrimonas citrea]
MRLVLWQLGVAAMAGFIFLIQGRRAALAALAGALVVALGNALAGARAFSPGGAGVALARLILGTLLKWAVVFTGVYVIMVRWQLPPAPAIAGLIMAVLVNLFALRFKQ